MNKKSKNMFSSGKRNNFLILHLSVSQVLWATLMPLVSVAIVVIFINNGSGYLNGNSRAKLLPMIYGTAQKPFVSRALVPLTTGVFMILMPDKIEQALKTITHKNPFLSHIFDERKWGKEYAPEYFIVILLIYASTIGFAYALRALLLELFDASNMFFVFVPLAALAGLPVFFNFGYIYDIPQLFLFTLNVYLLSKGYWKIYLIAFFLACLNKETSGLLILVFGIYFFDRQRMSLPDYVRIGSAQIVIFSLVKWILSVLYQANPGGAVENHLNGHLKFLLVPYSLSAFLSCGIVCLCIFAHWHLKPKLLKDALWIGIPLFMFFIMFGFRDEIRFFYELYPIAVCLIAQTVASIFNVPVTSNVWYHTKYVEIRGKLLAADGQLPRYGAEGMCASTR